jgi:hypothetical protein
VVITMSKKKNTFSITLFRYFVVCTGSSNRHLCGTTSGEYDGKRVIQYSRSGRRMTLAGKVAAEEAASSGPSSVSSAERRAEPSIVSGAAEYHEQDEQSARQCIISELSSKPNGASSAGRAERHAEH